MQLKHTPLIVGNWKMNPQSITVAKTLFYDVQKAMTRVRGVDVGIAPPSIYLAELRPFAKGKRLRLASQDIFWEPKGAYTGETSASMLKSVGVKYVIVGHSERRAGGETDEEVNKKVVAALKAEFDVIVCVGEKKRDTQGNYLEYVEKQVRAALAGVAKSKLGRIVIAYEPIWAIGTGKNATPTDAHEMKLFIQRVLTNMYGRPVLSKIRILYGGSVNAKNAELLLSEGMVDGFLVGGASLRAAEFATIVTLASKK